MTLESTGAHRDILGTDARVDTLLAVVIAENTDREKGWQYTGALLYDLRIPNPGPQQQVPMIGRISRDSRAVDAMSNHDGIVVNYEGLHLVMTGPGDGSMLMETCHRIGVTFFNR